jgi:MYXO-CTERM domain-containing protein
VLEPSQTANIHHDITLERAMLRDMGWETTCGNGMVDAGEQCDNGTANSDSLPDACRTSCLLAKCGDRVVDTGEQCDSAMSATPCNMNCTLPVCGDGMVAANEECDNGAANSNSTPDACRTTCKPASCGDGVVDSMEGCDAVTATCVQCMVVSGVGGGAGAGGSAATGGSAGLGTGGTAGMATTGGAGPTGAGGTTDTEDDPGKKDTGCGCHVPGSTNGSGSAWALVAAGVSLAAMRRTRRSRSFFSV